MVILIQNSIKYYLFWPTGNPITAAGKRKQIFRIFSVVCVPLLILIGMTANTFVTTMQSFVDATNIRDVLRFSTQLGTLIHQLQKERDQSALYLSTIGPETKRKLLTAYSATDIILEELEQWPRAADNNILHFQNKEKFQLYLNQHRYRLDTINQSVTSELQVWKLVFFLTPCQLKFVALLNTLLSLN